MSSFQRHVELRRLGNQLPMLGKANSYCKIIVKCCVLPVLSPGCVSLDKGALQIKQNSKKSRLILVGWSGWVQVSLGFFWFLKIFTKYP